MKKFLIILFAASLTFGCKGKNKHWPKKDSDDFTKGCMEKAIGGMDSTKAKSYCSCMLSKLEAKYSNANDAGKMDINTITEWAKVCIK